jgi:hypothetical protein
VLDEAGRSTFHGALMDSLFRITTLTVPTAPRAAASPPDLQEAVATGTKCLSALGLIAVMLIVLPMQSALEVFPLTFEEIAKEFSKQLDEAVKELSKP